MAIHKKTIFNHADNKYFSFKYQLLIAIGASFVKY